MANDELNRLCQLIHVDPDTTSDFAYQTMEIDGQSIVHVVPGDNSLAYIWMVLGSTNISDAMGSLVALGEEEQVSRKLSCFRLVLATPDVGAIEFEAHRVFKEIESKRPSTELILSGL
jgi:hypothetical protein